MTRQAQISRLQKHAPATGRVAKMNTQYFGVMRELRVNTSKRFIFVAETPICQDVPTIRTMCGRGYVGITLDVCPLLHLQPVPRQLPSVDVSGCVALVIPPLQCNRHFFVCAQAHEGRDRRETSLITTISPFLSCLLLRHHNNSLISKAFQVAISCNCVASRVAATC